MADAYAQNPAIKNFVEYLKIPSVHPNVDYSECVAFLRRQAGELGLALAVHEAVAGKPVVVMTWEGSEPALPSILLNSHMDVVPVFEESWTHPPFGGHITEDGKIFGRGAQDMKCVGVQYLEAIRRLKGAARAWAPKRSVHVCFVPDEEVGGREGMGAFVGGAAFAALRVGFALDEGIASPGGELLVFNAERSIWQIHVKCHGTPGHGSFLIPNTPGEKIRSIINKFMELREQQKQLLESDPALTLGDVTTVNLNQLYGGIQSNVIPEVLTAVFDVRLAVSVDHDRFEDMVRAWCAEAGEGVVYEFEQKHPKYGSTRVDDTNPYWLAFQETTRRLCVTYKTSAVANIALTALP